MLYCVENCEKYCCEKSIKLKMIVKNTTLDIPGKVHNKNRCKDYSHYGVRTK